MIEKNILASIILGNVKLAEVTQICFIGQRSSFGEVHQTGISVSSGLSL